MALPDSSLTGAQPQERHHDIGQKPAWDSQVLATLHFTTAALHYCTALLYITQHCSALHFTSLHCTVLNWTELHCVFRFQDVMQHAGSSSTKLVGELGSRIQMDDPCNIQVK